MTQTVEEKKPLEAFLEHLETLGTPEEKLRSALDFMQTSLSQSDGPNFKGFWEARKLCIPLFKESLPHGLREELWALYIELTQEGRRLKDLLDQESAFAVQQIEEAITGLEQQLEQDPTFTPPVELPPTKALSDFDYAGKQRRLNLLNTFATRINGLRKELIHTEMRIRIKNQLFKKLSALGDRIFPPRKELIAEVSTQFENDVKAFIDRNFSREVRHIYSLREEIKTLQGTAKLLTLTSHAFSTTRRELSTCWDKLKEFEKERKKASPPPKAPAQPPPVDTKRQEEARAAREKKRQELSAFKERLAQFEKSVETQGVAHLKSELESIQDELKKLDTSKSERHLFERNIKKLHHQIVEKEEESILELSDDERSALERTQHVLEQRKARRTAIKGQIEEYRKLLGGSTLDFEKGIEYNELMSKEKEQLENIDQSIWELEKTIRDLKKST